MQDSNERPTSRRSVLRSGALLPAVGVWWGDTGGRASTSQEREDEQTLAAGLDTNFDLQSELQFERAPDPSRGSGNRGRVLRATSDGVATPDYAVTLVVTTDEDLALSDLVEADDEEGFAYDYLAGEDETGPVPDEAWLVLRSTKENREGLNPVLRTEVDDEAADGWRTRTVGPEIVGTVPEEGSGQEWKAFDRTALTVERIGTDIVERFGADASVLAAGIGRGTPSTEPTVADAYFDAFVLDGEERTLEATRKRRGEGAGSRGR